MRIFSAMTAKDFADRAELVGGRVRQQRLEELLHVAGQTQGTGVASRPSPRMRQRHLPSASPARNPLASSNLAGFNPALQAENHCLLNCLLEAAGPVRPCP